MSSDPWTTRTIPCTVRVMATITQHATMSAAQHDRYGGPEVLHVGEAATPVPADDEVLVEVHVATVNRTDCGFRLPRPFIVRFFSGLRRPKYRILGTEFAGVVVAKGPSVTKFEIGDRVFGVNERFGANAEFMCVRQDVSITTMPHDRSFADMAAVGDGGILAMTCLNWSDLQRRAADPDLRRVGRHRHRCRAVGEAPRRPRHGGLRHGQRRDGGLPRAGRRHRLRADRLHRHRRDVRRGVRRGRQVVVPPLSGTGATWREVRVDRPRIHVAEPGPRRAHREVGPEAGADAAAQVQPGQGRDTAFTRRVRRLPRRRRPDLPLGEVVEATRYVESHQKQGNVLLLVTAEPATR